MGANADTDTHSADIRSVRVAVGILQRACGEVLVAERAAHRHAGGGLEFPGGKCEPGESLHGALAREIGEELGVTIAHWEPLIRVRHDYGDRRVVLGACRITDWVGEPHGAEGQAIHWVSPAVLDMGALPAANRPILAALRSPARCLVTPDTDQVGSSAELIRGIEAAIAGSRVGMVQLRRHDRGTAGWWALVREAVQCCADRDVPCLVNVDPEQIPDLPERAGVHLRAGVARTLTQRPVDPAVPFSCAAHDAAELAHARWLGADYAFLGPVHPTASHPGGAALGWSAFAALTATTDLPIYALGGLVPQDLAAARAAGAIGVAGIRGFWS